MSRVVGSIAKLKGGLPPICLATVFLFLCLGVGCDTQTPSRTHGAVLLWTVDLSRDADFKTRLQEDPTLLRPPTINFLTANQILLAFDDKVVLPAPVLKPFAFHVVEINSESGTKGKSLSFPVTLDLSQVEVIAGGNFLVLAGEKLIKYSDDFKEVSSLAIPLSLHGQPTEQILGGITFWNPRYETWQIHVAPRGETVLLEHINKPMHMEFQWLQASDFSSVQKMTSDVTRYIADAGNRDVLVNDLPPRGPFLLSPDSRSSIGKNGESARMISENLFFIDQGSSYEIRTASGEVRANGSLEAGADPVRRSMNSTRFAYSTGAYDGQGFPLQTNFPSVHMDVRVFDWKEMKQVANVSLHKAATGNVSTGYRQSAIALSPDGKLLAILDDSTLSCYRLP